MKEQIPQQTAKNSIAPKNHHPKKEQIAMTIHETNKKQPLKSFYIEDQQFPMSGKALLHKASSAGLS